MITPPGEVAELLMELAQPWGSEAPCWAASATRVGVLFRACPAPAATRTMMKARWIAFGEIELEGRRYTHDVVIEAGRVEKRSKKPSKADRGQFGHTPLSAREKIPWGGRRLIIGTGQSGMLPIMRAVWAEGEQRGVEIVAVPTEEALRLLRDVKAKDAYAVVHVTC